MHNTTVNVSFYTSTEPRAHSFTDADFIQWVNAALKNYQSVLALARSPLANSALVAPLLVLDDVSPTADERGQALRLVLRWAIDCLAPALVQYPLGEFRPLDDPTWRDPHWWRYNILRHRYLEPLHPDEFIEGGRSTETLIALTGIPSADTFFDERNRAIREVVHSLQRQLVDGHANEQLQQMALEQVYRPLQSCEQERALLGIAATFDDVFPRALLFTLAANEHLTQTEAALDYLTEHRFLLVGDGALNLWLSPVLRAYVYARQSLARLRLRHQQIAEYYLLEHEPLRAARHFQQAQRWPDAAACLLPAANDLIHELQWDELCNILQTFKANDLPATQWRTIQLLLSDLFSKSGQQEAALSACRRALKVSADAIDQAQIYRRMGKLYEHHNELHALGYYQQAVERLPLQHPELLDLLKDRAWLYIFRQEWSKAEADLALALGQVTQAMREQRANIYDAFASLYRRQKQYDRAIQYAQKALAIREEIGDLLRVADSSNNLGLIYTDMGEYRFAIAAYEEALKTFQKLENREAIAKTLLNIGLVHHLDQHLRVAIEFYQRSLTLSQETRSPLQEVAAHSNLAEAFAELGQNEKAIYHWQTGYELSCQAGFEGQIKYFKELQAKMPALQTTDKAEVTQTTVLLPSRDPVTDPEVRAILQMATEEGRLTPKLLMETLHISKATATRRLAELVERGYLEKQGEGRGTYYVLCEQPHQTGRASKPSEFDVLQEKLRQQEQHLRQQHGIIAFGIVQEAARKPLTGVVRFAVLPDLHRFFALEKALGKLVGVPFDLLPADATDLTPTLWLWQ